MHPVHVLTTKLVIKIVRKLPTAAPPHFRPMPIVAKQLPISATAELLSQIFWHILCQNAN